ncbi:ArsR/SmtB family transcription factor [Qipengyuania mesophila]|uniref:ArsR/SmtB family transcription factor n=1 Tax=Qipengyuania mesophila TaxID=2867246 RepID=UPI0035179519
MTDEEALASFAALAQEHRLAAFRRMVRAGEDGVSAGTIAEELGLPPSSLSFHLKELGAAGLVKQERQHRTILYRADFTAVDDLVGYLLANCCEDACNPSPQEKETPK